MANTRITRLNDTPNGTGNLFRDYAGGSFSLDPGAFLSTRSGNAVELGGDFTAKIDGTIRSAGAGNIGLTISAVSIGDNSSLDVGRTGSIYGRAVGFYTNEAVALTNGGSISGGIGIFQSASANYEMFNIGTITGITSAIDFSGTGLHKLVNTGTVTSTAFAMRGGVGSAAGSEWVINSGRISGEISLADGNDTFTNYAGTRQGTVIGLIDLGAGRDVVNGGNLVELVKDGGGADVVRLGGGHDTYLAVRSTLASADATDTIVGGDGIDTYDASASTTPVYVNLDSVVHSGPGLGVTAYAQRVSGFHTGTDSLTGFENVMGGMSTDVIFGSTGANIIFGNSGGDDLFGLAGNDRLYGSDGSDYINGGLGADLLYGGIDRDRFMFQAVDESTVAAGGRDTIMDFSIVEGDRIDLLDIDADVTALGNQAFSLTGSAGYAGFTGVAGQLMFSATTNGTLVSGDVNGDAVADFAVQVVGITTMLASDFYL